MTRFVARLGGRAGRIALQLLPTLLAVLLALAGERTEFPMTIEARTLDWRFQLRGETAPSGDVALVMIDDRSVSALGGWPLPRNRLAEIVAVLSRGGARVIVFDLLLTEPGRPLRESRIGDSSPVNLYTLLDDREGALAGAMASAGNTILPFAFVFGHRGAVEDGMPDAIQAAAFRLTLEEPGRQPHLSPQPTGVLAPSRSLATATQALGHVSVLLDRDGALRHDLAVVPFGGAYFPSIAIEAVRLFDRTSPDDVLVHLGAGLEIGDRWLPTGRDMRLTANYYGGGGAFETHSLVDVLDGTVDAEAFSDRIVLIGANALGIGDTFATPFSETLPGAEFLATVIDNALHDRTIDRRDWTLAVDLLAIVVLGMVTIALWRFLPPLSAIATTAILIAGWLTLTTLLLSLTHVWIGVAFPLTAVIATAALLGSTRLTVERRNRRDVERRQANIRRYLSPALSAQMADGGSPVTDDRTFQAAVMFVDIIGFTSMAERASSKETMDLLRGFHGRVEHAVTQHSGVVDKFVGDGALACFGVLEPSPHDPANALAAAEALAVDVDDWNQVRRAQGDAVINIGIGVHYGPVLAGEIGGKEHADFTVTGDTVNVASRLEYLTRDIGTPIVASDTVIEAARAQAGNAVTARFRRMAPRQLRGRSQAMVLWSWRPAAVPIDDGEVLATGI